MARDRKRAKQRRERQAKAEGTQARRAKRAAAPPHGLPGHEHEPPELASGEIDIADAQLALGRPELIDVGAGNGGEAAPRDDDDEHAFADEGEFERLEDDVDAAEARFEAGEPEPAGEGGAAVATRTARAERAPARSEGNRFANFLRGSWRELQRVQWPDRRQVGQATAVVIGFVIVAGAFLGVMDFFAAKIVDFIV